MRGVSPGQGGGARECFLWSRLLQAARAPLRGLAALRAGPPRPPARAPPFIFKDRVTTAISCSFVRFPERRHLKGPGAVARLSTGRGGRRWTRTGPGWPRSQQARSGSLCEPCPHPGGSRRLAVSRTSESKQRRKVGSQGCVQCQDAELPAARGWRCPRAPGARWSSGRVCPVSAPCVLDRSEGLISAFNMQIRAWAD